MNFEIEPKGPLIPTNVDPKFFNSVKVQPMGNITFKAGNVVKMTSGKIRLRNAEEKAFKDGNSAYAEKNDIIRITGAVYAANEDKNDHAAARVFAQNK